MSWLTRIFQYVGKDKRVLQKEQKYQVKWDLPESKFQDVDTSDILSATWKGTTPAAKNCAMWKLKLAQFCEVYR